MYGAGLIWFVVALCSLAFKHAGGHYVFDPRAACNEEECLNTEVENIRASYCGSCIFFNCDGFTGSNKMVKLGWEPDPVSGNTLSFNINVKDLYDGLQSSITFYRFSPTANLMLRWDRSGNQMVPRWKIWTPGASFQVIAESSIIPGSGEHYVTLTASPTRIEIIEDGKHVGGMDGDYNSVAVHFDMQTYTKGATFHIDLSDITYKPGFPLPEVRAT